MADAPAQPGGAPPARGQARPQQGGINQLLSTIARFAIMWYFMSWMKGNQQGSAPAGGAVSPGASAPLYRKGDAVDMYVYLSEQITLPPDRDGASLIWAQHGLSLATGAQQTETYTYKPSKAVKNNGTLYAHVVFMRAGLDASLPLSELPRDAWWSKSHSLITHAPPRVNKTGTKLLSEGGNLTAARAPTPADDGTPPPWMAFYRPNLTIAMVDHFMGYQRNSIPPQVLEHLQLNDEGQQLPLIYFDDFWLLRDKLVPMNESVESLPLYLAVGPKNFMWMQLQQQMEQSFKLQQSTGLASQGESDEVKRIFLEGNPYLLALTMAVSMLHSVFDFLAFKNDIGFWKENKSMEGLSARSIVINAFCQLVIFLYLLDNETSMVVLLSAGVGTAIEFWKVTKAMEVTVMPAWPFVRIADRASYSNNQTREHDAVAMRYLSYVLYPLVVGYSIYTLVYETHRSWYSWLLSSLVGAVYMFGFILMCPQLYLNYKLQSVAHLPWRQMTYKFLNTIIDDLFAFVIKMPTLHRLSVFRDDVIFLIYLYQRWIYRVDMTRVNEFGFSGAAAAEGTAALGAADGATEDEAPEQPAGEVGAPEESAARRRRGGGAAQQAAADGSADAGDSGSADAARSSDKKAA